jgi:epoxyqueuosine reductase
MKPEKIIKAEAKNLGFSLAGITKPDTPDHFGVFEAWLASSYQADMNYLSRSDTVAKRKQPKELMPDCRSIICLAFPYPNKNDFVVNDHKPTGRIAAYAWLPDYHSTIPILINELITRIENNLGKKITYKAFTDSAPILERDIAQRSGLGWIGKNSCLIHPDHGSFFLLAEVFTDLELENDQPFLADRCGSCNRCLDACPTHCILPDRTVDANRCISYLTIENKGPIPCDLRKYTGNWVFGCDICQMVCPWNRLRVCNFKQLNLGASERKLFLPDTIEELSMSDKEFQGRFAGTPILRLKWKGYLRNVATALGNLKSGEAVSTLVNSLLVENEPLIRGAVAWALGQIGGQKARSALRDQLVQESDAIVREELQLALKIIENNAA